MADAAISGDIAFRDHNVTGVPSSQEFPPDKALIRRWARWVEQNTGAIVSRKTLPALAMIEPADGTYPRGEVSTGADAGWYNWSGTEWELARSFPDTAARLVSIGGTKNAITAATEGGVDPAVAVVLFLTPTLAPDDATTIAVDGESPRALLTFDGAPIEAGFVLASTPVPIYDTGTEYRLMFDHRWLTLATQTLAARNQSAEARDKAEQWADNAENVPVETGQFSSRHHAVKSAASASASDASEVAAEGFRDGAEVLRDETATLRAGTQLYSDNAAASAAASGPVAKLYLTKSAATADLGTRTVDEVVEIAADESRQGHRVRYKITTGPALTFLYDLQPVGDVTYDEASGASTNLPLTIEVARNEGATAAGDLAAPRRFKRSLASPVYTGYQTPDGQYWDLIDKSPVLASDHILAGRSHTTILQKAFAAAQAKRTGLMIDTGLAPLAIADVIGTITTPILIAGVGNGVTLEQVAGMGMNGLAMFRFDNTFADLAAAFPNSAGRETADIVSANLKSGASIGNLKLIGRRSGGVTGRAIDFNDRNDMCFLHDLFIYNFRGEAIRFTGTRPNIRESTWSRINVRACGDAFQDIAAIDISSGREGNFFNATCTVAGTSLTLTGAGNTFADSALLGLGDSAFEITIANAGAGGAIAFDTTMTVIDATHATLGSAAPVGGTGKPVAWSRKVDGSNHLSIIDSQSVGNFGPCIRIENRKSGGMRRINFKNMMVHGSGANKDIDGGGFCDLVQFRGNIGSIEMDLRINGSEGNGTVKKAAIRFSPDPVIPNWQTSQAEIHANILNLENTSEGYFVIEANGIQSGAIWGQINNNVNTSGPELVVKSEGVLGTLTYAVLESSVNVRNNQTTPAFSIHPTCALRVFTRFDRNDDLLPSMQRLLTLADVKSPAFAPAKIRFGRDDDPIASADQSPYQLFMRSANGAETMANLMWHYNNGANTGWVKFQWAGITCSIDQARNIEAATNAGTPQNGEMRHHTGLGKPIWRSGSTAQSPWIDGCGTTCVIPGLVIGGAGKGAWVLSTAVGSSNEYYLLPTGGGGLIDVVQLIEDEIFPFSAGAVGSLAAGQFAIADNDSLGFMTLYVRMYNTALPVPSATTGGAVASRLRYRTAAHGAVTPTPRRLFGAAANPPTAAYYLRGDTYLCIAPAAVTTGTNIQFFNNVTGRGGSWSPMAEIVT